jgi:enoyl-CoA hydratase/carnithine racemase
VLHGAVVGGGLELASAAHIRVAEASTFYALPEGQRGLFVGGGGSARVPRLIGASRMADMMLTGRVLDAEEGMRIGLSQYLVENGKGLERALALAEKVAANAPLSNFAVVHALPRIAEMSRDEGLFTESLMAAIAQGDDAAKRRMREFLDGKAGKVGKT